MLAGRRFKLREPVIGTTAENNGRTVAWLVPSSSVIEIISRTASGLRLLDVRWDGRILAMSVSDIAERGDELFEATADYARQSVEKVMRAASC
jgi:hypothetical protein